jgi:drug/metabolite transporter (DMT)-like permease
MTNARKDIGTDLSLVGLAVIWGVNFSVLKVLLEEIDPLALNALRFPLAALALGALLWGRPGPLLPERKDVPRVILLALLGNVLYQLCFIFGIDWTLAGNASLLLSTTPVWTVIFSSIAGHEPPTRWVILGVSATLVGMTLVVWGRGDALSLGSETVRGDLLMVAASILWSAYTVGGRTPVSKYGPLRMTSWAIWIATPFLVLMGLPSLRTTELSGISVRSWLGVAYAGLLAIALAYVLWYRGVQRLGNSRTAVYSNLVPVAALITAWVWLGETPARTQLLGAGIILGGLTVARLAQAPESNSRR